MGLSDLLDLIPILRYFFWPDIEGMLRKRDVSGLNRALFHHDWTIRSRAAAALGKIRDKGAVEALIRALDDKEAQVRCDVAKALGEIRDKGAVEALIRALDEKEARVRCDVAKALGEIRGERAVEALIQALGDKDSKVRSRVVQALGKIGGSSATEVLVKALEDEEPQMRKEAAKAVGKIAKKGDSEAMEGLLHALRSTRTDVCISARSALWETEDPRPLEQLLHSLKAKDKDLRLGVLSILSMIGNEHTVEPLVHALHDSDPDVQSAAVDALRKLGVRYRSSIDELVRVLKTGDSGLKLLAADALAYLAKIGNKRAKQALTEALSDPDESVRVKAAILLQDIKREIAAERAEERPAKRYKCSSCGAYQADGAWEKAMDAKAKAAGMKGFVNLSSPPQCLKCGSTQLEDLWVPDKERRRICKKKESARGKPEYDELIELLKRWQTDYRTRSRTEKKIGAIGARLADQGGRDLMYSVCTSIDQPDWQNVVSGCWDGVGDWQH